MGEDDTFSVAVHNWEVFEFEKNNEDIIEETLGEVLDLYLNMYHVYRIKQKNRDKMSGWKYSRMEFFPNHKRTP